MDAALIIAYKDNGEPVASDGRLAVFPTIKAARNKAGALGVAVPVSPSRVRELCKQHKLGLPDLRRLCGKEAEE